ncbi:LAFA_0F15478g1_1 [Lachancea sp. 'fantastica']|nr:LAFA_0F15478g1_1 [Lachancea sp. 'fantastica']
MDSDLSSVELDAEVYEESPDLPEDSPYGSDREEDDEYQYTPEIEEDDEKVQPSGSSRSKRGAARSTDEYDPAGRTAGQKRVVEDDFEEPSSSPAKRSRRNAGIDLQNLDDEDEDDGYGDDDVHGEEGQQDGGDEADAAINASASASASASEQEKAERPQDSNKTSRSKIMMELLDNSSRRNSKLSEKELQLRRAENARKRKNLSEKKLEEEKQDTINKLLRRRAGRTRGPVPADRDKKSEDPQDENAEFTKPRRSYNSKGMVRILQNANETVYATF